MNWVRRKSARQNPSYLGYGGISFVERENERPLLPFWTSMEMIMRRAKVKAEICWV